MAKAFFFPLSELSEGGLGVDSPYPKEVVMRGPLTEKQKELLGLFKTAIESEREAQKLYRKMLFAYQETSFRSIVETFIAEEKKHEESLLNMYNDWRKTGEFQDIA